MTCKSITEGKCTCGAHARDMNCPICGPVYDCINKQQKEIKIMEPLKPDPNRKFYMVWVSNKTGSTAKHETYAAALKEAERLAAVPGNADVFVLETTQRVFKENPPVRSQSMYYGTAGDVRS